MLPQNASFLDSAPQSARHVWIVHNNAISPSEKGSLRHFTLGKYLVQKGWKVTILCSNFNHFCRTYFEPKTKRQWTRECHHNVDFIRIPSPSYTKNGTKRVYNMIVFAIKIALELRKTQVQNPDFIIGSSPDLFSALSARYIAYQYQVPFVLEIRDLWPLSMVKLRKSMRFHPLVFCFRWIEKYLYYRADTIISLLHNTHAHMQKISPGSEQKIHWIPNGIDIGLFPKPGPPKRSSQFTIMYCGSFGLANHLDLLLEIVHHVPQKVNGKEIVFRLIGDGIRKQCLLLHIQKENIRNVHVELPLPHKILYNTMQEADAFLIPSHNTDLYTCGVSLNKLFECLAASRPTICCFHPDVLPQYRDSGILFAPPHNLNTIVSTITSLAHMSQSELIEIGEKGRRYVEKFHSYEMLAEQLKKILSSFL